MPNVGIAELVVLVATIAVVIAIPAAVILLVVRVRDRARAPLIGSAPASGAGPGPIVPSHDPAIDTVRTRFANGEIDEAEYERLRSVLQRR